MSIDKINLLSEIFLVEYYFLFKFFLPPFPILPRRMDRLLPSFAAAEHIGALCPRPVVNSTGTAAAPFISEATSQVCSALPRAHFLESNVIFSWSVDSINPSFDIYEVRVPSAQRPAATTHPLADAAAPARRLSPPSLRVRLSSPLTCISVSFYRFGLFPA
jgi:hypothetical protein